ncbi:MAG: hypothetical protein OXU61_02585 [Gammaproteobacteria bacterium]|nr:hypothetical protein [Gammaproteobacteria bacterium]
MRCGVSSGFGGLCGLAYANSTRIRAPEGTRSLAQWHMRLNEGRDANGK